MNQTQNELSKNNNIIIKIDSPKNEDNQNDKNNEEEKKYVMHIQSNYRSANYRYVKNYQTIATSKIKSKEQKDNENIYLNKNKEILNPLIHFTNLSSKKLKILGSFSKSKTDNSKTNA